MQGFPILSVLLYGYVFGSAMQVPGGGDYRDFLMPGMFVMTMAFGFINTATLVVYDSTKGVIDRFRSMPMAPSAVVAGRGVTDLLVACAELAIMMLTALAMGWRPDAGYFHLAPGASRELVLTARAPGVPAPRGFVHALGASPTRVSAT